MGLATGVDMIEIERVREAIDRQGDRFLNRIFTPRELEENQRKAESLAGRFAAKESVAKALGCGIGDVGWKEIEILRADRGAPRLVLHGEAEKKANELGIRSWSLSISHTKNEAIAFVVGIS
ncbi:MAG: holo-ACP synthase [Chloroflexota bacterium]